MRESNSSASHVFVAWVVIFASAASIFTADLLSQHRQASAKHSNELQLELAARYAVGAKAFFGSALSANPSSVKGLSAQVDAAAISEVDQLRVIPVDIELDGSKDADARIGAFLKTNHDAELARDAATLRSIYDDAPEFVPQSEKDRLIARHGWYAELALSHDLPANNPQRLAAIGPAKQTVAALATGGLLILVGLAAGIGLLIYFSIKWNQMPVMAEYGAAPGGILLEGFAVYLLSLAILFLTSRFLLSGVGVAVEGLLVLPFVLAFFWVRFRGVAWGDLCRAIGWTRGRGIVREMVAGIIGYIAGFPVLLSGFLAVVILSKISHASATQHPIVRQILQPGGERLFLFFLACIFAPITEESMFRGMLLSHLRIRHYWITSALLVSLLFAAIHPQGWVAIPALGAIAMTLAAIREKRGSLVASMTAHALNNFSLLVFLVAAAG